MTVINSYIAELEESNSTDNKQDENSIQLITACFPELRKIYDDDKDYYVGLPYLFYESEFTQYILVQVKLNNFNRLKEIFDFVEDMLVNGDEKIKSLIGVAIVESLAFEVDFRKNYLQLLPLIGKETQKSFDEIKRIYSREEI